MEKELASLIRREHGGQDEPERYVLSRPARWSARAFKNQGIAFALVGVVGAMVVTIHPFFHAIAPVARHRQIGVSEAFVLVGSVNYVIGWRKGRRKEP